MPRINAEIPNYIDPRPLDERPLHDADHASLKRGTNRMVSANSVESPLSGLHTRGDLTDRQLLAGEKLRHDYEAAAIGPNVTMRRENIPLSRQRRGVTPGLNQTERMMSTKARFDDAMAALGPDPSDIAWRVICAGESMPDAERQKAWPLQSGELVLRIALDRLAGCYRLPG